MLANYLLITENTDLRATWHRQLPDPRLCLHWPHEGSVSPIDAFIRHRDRR